MTVTVITKCDENFFSGVVALINSLDYIKTEVKICVLDFGMNSKQKKWLIERECVVKEIIPVYFSHSSTLIGTNYNSSIYALLYIENIQTDYIVHLDADVIIVGGFEKFLNNLKHFDFVAPTDYPPLKISDQIGSEKSLNTLISNYGNSFFSKAILSKNSINAGVWAIKTKMFNPLRKIMVEIYNLGIILPMRDQSLLNIALVLASFKVCKLGYEYNYRAHFRRAHYLRATTIENSTLPPKIKYKNQDIWFLHFIGCKPWQTPFKGDERLKAVWEKYYHL